VELKFHPDLRHIFEYQSFNRTKVELKSSKPSHTIPRSQPFNRTKVELKSPLSVCDTYRDCLSTEPKWNWNVTGLVSVELLITFNRTKVELKCKNYLSYLKIEETFNRTKVELKCSFVEAKTWTFAIFQPNQSGIEIDSVHPHSDLTGNFQPNQSGIEINKEVERTILTRLSTEPKWNWNQRMQELDFVSPTLSTEPKWNWNVPTTIDQRGAFTFNRTKVELKSLSFYRFHASFYFQPNQSGIEIRGAFSLVTVSCIFQPNQSGIEIVRGFR